MNATTLIAGPQFTGSVILIVGLVMKYYPPKNINGMYGYRTPRSMQSQRNWDEGNEYSANLMVKLGGGGVALGILLILFLPQRLLFVSVAVMLISLIATVVILLTATERHLKNLPDAL